LKLDFTDSVFELQQSRETKQISRGLWKCKPEATLKKPKANFTKIAHDSRLTCAWIRILDINEGTREKNADG
jgi:hypothetical protein